MCSSSKHMAVSPVSLYVLYLKMIQLNVPHMHKTMVYLTHQAGNTSSKWPDKSRLSSPYSRQKAKQMQYTSLEWEFHATLLRLMYLTKRMVTPSGKTVDFLRSVNCLSRKCSLTWASTHLLLKDTRKSESMLCMISSMIYATKDAWWQMDASLSHPMMHILVSFLYVPFVLHLWLENSMVSRSWLETLAMHI